MIRICIIACLVWLLSSCSTVATKKTEVEDKPVTPEAVMTPEVRATAENFVSDGVSSYQSGNYAEAVNSWQEAIELIPGDAEVHNFVGIAHHKLGEYDKAIQQFTIATELDSTYFEAFNNLGYMQFLKEDYDNALLSFQKSLAINPNYDPAKLNKSKTQKRFLS
jgi:Flp pilus assembly protein TadD